ncbi:MAG TPA: GNAT family N-acetyltransferase, partial [Kiloniellaceae bacterium]|nr:GNAT family N-acetyltransferase [Kiloniellaceae bacterium]
MHDLTPSKPPAAASPLAQYRDARAGDARAIARLIEIAGEGIPGFLWSESAAPG